MTKLALPRRWLAIAIAVVVPSALMGYLTGVGPPSVQRRTAPAAAPATRTTVPGYADLRSMRRGVNAHMYEGAFDALAKAAPAPLEPGQPSVAERQLALAGRRERRAYDGAPPTIPHRIGQRDAPDCLACHGQAMTIGQHRAPGLPHAHYDNCTQCHVVGADPRPNGPATVLSESLFVGLDSPVRGERAWPGAPPTIPHATLMRGECTSCHGVGGRLGMRSPHPDRQNCQQCHAPSAALNQRRATPGVSPSIAWR